jgi:hypothetical protein
VFDRGRECLHACAVHSAFEKWLELAAKRLTFERGLARGRSSQLERAVGDDSLAAQTGARSRSCRYRSTAAPIPSPPPFRLLMDVDFGRTLKRSTHHPRRPKLLRWSDRLHSMEARPHCVLSVSRESRFSDRRVPEAMLRPRVQRSAVPLLLLSAVVTYW